MLPTSDATLDLWMYARVELGALLEDGAFENFQARFAVRLARFAFLNPQQTSPVNAQVPGNEGLGWGWLAGPSSLRRLLGL